MTRTVAVVDHRFADLGVERALLAPHGLGVVDSAGLDRDAVLDACAEVDAVLVGARFRMNTAAIARLGRCRVIVRHGVGVDNVDVDAAARAGIWVAYVPDYCIDEVADHAIAMLLALSRRLPNLDRDVRAGAWGIPAGLPVRRLSTQTLGVVGFGRIGEAVGRRARAFGLRVLAADPVRDAEEVRAVGAEPVTLDALLERSDLVTLHAPPAHGGPVLSAAAIARMKPGAAVVNVARGGLIDERAMVAALRDGRLAGAALDVAAAEPLRPDDPLLAAPNVLVTPHAAWYSLDAVQELREKAVAEVVRVLSGETPLNPANSPVSEVAA